MNIDTLLNLTKARLHTIETQIASGDHATAPAALVLELTRLLEALADNHASLFRVCETLVGQVKSRERVIYELRKQLILAQQKIRELDAGGYLQ